MPLCPWHMQLLLRQIFYLLETTLCPTRGQFPQQQPLRRTWNLLVVVPLPAFPLKEPKSKFGSRGKILHLSLMGKCKSYFLRRDFYVLKDPVLWFLSKKSTVNSLMETNGLDKHLFWHMTTHKALRLRQRWWHLKITKSVCDWNISSVQIILH